MAPRARGLAVAILVLRVVTLGVLAASLGVIATTARTHYDPIGEDVGQIYDISFQDLYTYRRGFNLPQLYMGVTYITF